MSFVQVADGLAIVDEILRIRRGERRGPDGRPDVEVDWRALSPWVVENDQVRIFLLARSEGDDPDERMPALRRELEMAFVHFYGGDGFHAESPLYPDEGYGLVLSREELVSFPRAVWRVQDYAFTLGHAVDPHASDATTLALHIFPAEWRWPVLGNADTKRAASHRRRIEKQVREANASWTWPEDADE